MALDLQDNINNAELSHFSLKNQHNSPEMKANSVCIGQTFRIEWRDPVNIEALEDTGVEFDYDPSRCLRFEVPEGLGWVRAFIGGAPDVDSVLALVDIKIRLLTKWDGKVESMWVESRGTKNPRRYEIPNSRERAQLTDNDIYHIKCSAFINLLRFEGDIGFVLNLPLGSTVEILSADLVWIPTDGIEVDSTKLGEIEKSTTIVIRDREINSSELSLLAFSGMLKRLFEQKDDMPLRIAKLLMCARSSTELEFLSILFKHVSVNYLNNNLHQSTGPICFGGHECFLDVALKLATNLSCAKLEEDDTLSISEIYRVCSDDGGLQLGEIRELQVRVDLSIEEDQKYWKSLVDSGVVSGFVEFESHNAKGQILDAESNLRVSPIALAAMRRAAILENGATILSKKVGDTSLGSWRSEIPPFEEEGTLRKVATLGPTNSHAITKPERATQIKLVLRTNNATGSSRKSYQIALKDAYCFVVRLQPGLDLSKVVNIENCLIFDSFCELKQAVMECDDNLGHKPVVPIMGIDEEDVHHVINAVQRFWAYSCSYVITRGHYTYQASSGQIAAQTSFQVQLSRIAITSCTLCLPTKEVIDADDDQISRIDYGIFIPTCGFTVSSPIVNPGEKKLLESRVKFANNELLTSEIKEQLVLFGPVGISAIESLEYKHWRLSGVIGKRLFERKRALAGVSTFSRTHDINVARTILELVKAAPDDWPLTGTDLDEFLLEIASKPKIYLGIAHPLYLLFLKRLRYSKVADESAALLLYSIEEICSADIKNIIPTFEFLAMCLSQEELDKALMMATRLQGGKRIRLTYRIAECFKRYGSPKALQLFAIITIERQPELLREREFLRFLGRLITTEDRQLFDSYLGSDFLKSIEKEIGTIDRVLQKIRDEDREAALAILGDADGNKSLNVRELMNELRAFSNELYRMALPLSEILLPGVFSLSERRLAALIFRDIVALRGLEDSGALEQPSDENALAKSQLGDNRMLNSIIAKPFSNANLCALEIEGDTISEVFRNAQAKLSEINPTLDGPLVTVVMSAFNPNISLMRQALDSLRLQTHKNIEVIVIDDASEHEYKSKIASLVSEFKFATLVQLEENAGPYVGRNIALKLARGEFIAIQDADDWSHPQRLSAQLEALKATPEARLVTGKHIRVDLTGKVQMEANFTIVGDGPMSSLFRRSVFDEIGPFALVRSRGDIEMRERIRDFYGEHAIFEMPVVLLLCLADSQTLSQSVKHQNAEHLQLWRTNISQRGSLSRFRSKDSNFGEVPKVLVPYALRSTQPEI